MPPENWPAAFQAAHQRVAEFLGIRDETRLLWTPGCTSALSLAIDDHDWQPGDRVLTSGFEHHALHRPLLKLVEQGVQLEIIPPDIEKPIDLEKLQTSLASNPVKMVALTAASNVTGDLLPIDTITSLAHDAGALVLVDGAQVVGWQTLNLSQSSVDLFAFGGHKGLHAPWGIGGLYVAPHVDMHCQSATCEVPPSSNTPSGVSDQQPSRRMPGYCDAGSVDQIALSGLQAAIPWLEAQPQRLAQAREKAARLRKVIEGLSGALLYGSHEATRRLPTVAFTIRGTAPSQIGRQLASSGVTVAAGLQCAPLAHEVLGTAPDGVVRLSVGPTNTDADIQYACEMLESLPPT